MEKKNPRGMAPEEPVPHRNMLRKVITATVTPGKKQATRQHTCGGRGGAGGGMRWWLWEQLWGVRCAGGMGIQIANDPNRWRLPPCTISAPRPPTLNQPS